MIADKDNSKTYQKILKHRKNCKKWGKEFCLDCFGGGLTQFTRNLEKEKKTCEICGKKDRQGSPVFICDACANEHHEKMKEPIEKLYNLNADISMKFVAMKKEPVLGDMWELNRNLGEIIKDLRGVVE